jgi:phage-related baseplate assembly protein
MDLVTPPDFIKLSQADFLAMFIQNYQTAYFNLTGNTIELNPAQAEQLLINAGSYLINTFAMRVNSAALQNLPQFATGAQLDMLSQPFGVTRNPQQFALTTVLFTLIAGHGDLVIPAGTRIQSTDGLQTFATQSAIAVPAGVLTVSATVVCDTAGVAGNGYIAGKISNILDPQAYLVSASNTDTSNNGSEVETDASLRKRLYLSAASFSTAGSEDSYKYFAFSASSLILDVKVVGNPTNGVVSIYPLVAGGTTPDEILNAVDAACSPKNRRPLTDTVLVLSPTVINYALNMGIVAYGSVADPTALETAARLAVQGLADSNSIQLGIDIIQSQFIAAASLPGVAKVSITAPSADIVIGDTQVGICTGLTFSLTGFNYDK